MSKNTVVREKFEKAVNFMCGEFHINIQKCQHAEYLNGWIAAIRKNNNILWSAASQAQKATDFLLEIGSAA